MQTRDAVEGLHNCQEFSQLPLVFRWGYGNTETVLYCFYKMFVKDNSTNEGKYWFLYFLIETDFLNTRSYFLPTNQNARLTIHNQSKFVWCNSRVPYCHLNKAIDQWECAYYPNYFIITNRVVFKWLSKVSVQLRFLRLVIGLKIWRLIINQWEGKPERIETSTPDFSRALSKLHGTTKNLNWFVVLFEPAVIGRSRASFNRVT